MPLSLYYGNPKHGKTYGVVENVVIPALQEGRRIETNIPLQLDAIRETYTDADIRFFTTEESKQPGFFSTVAPGALFIYGEQL